MPHALSLTNGITTISLSTDGVQLMHFVPQTAKKMVQPRGTDDYEDVAEAIEVFLYADTTTAMQSLHNSIETMLDGAGAPYGAKVYLQYQPIGDLFVWRAEVRAGGTITLGDDAPQSFGQAKIEARIILTRRGFWEGPEKEASLTSALGPGQGGIGRKIRWNGINNYVDVAAGDTLGSLRTPAKIRFSNNNGGTQQPRQIYVATTGNMAHAPAVANTPFSEILGDFTHVLEGEDASGGTVTAGGTNNSSSYFLGMDFSGTNIVTWTLSAYTVYALSGREFRLLARFNWYPAGSPIYVTPSIPGLALTGDEVQLPQPTVEFVDLGSLRLPSSRLSNPGATTISLTFRTTVTTQIELDFVQLTLADGLRVIDYLGGNWNANELIIDDAPGEIAYSQDGTTQGADVAVYGSPVWLYPTIWPQRVYVMTNNGYNALVNRTYNVRIYYRPRRLTI